MAELQETFIYRVEYDTASAQKNMEALATEQVTLREQQKELTRLYNAGSISLEQYGKELAVNQQQLRKNSKELQDTRKVLDTTNGSLGAQRLRLSQLKKEWIDQEKVTKEGKKRFNELGKEIKALNDDIKKQEQGVGDFRRSVGDYTNSIKTALLETNLFGVNLGKASAAMQLATTATGKGTSALRLFKLALASTGIGLLIVALGTLITYFSRTQKGIDLFNKAMAGVSAVTGVLTDRIGRLGGILIDVFTGKTGIVEGARQAAQAVTGIGDEIEREIRLAAELEQRSQDLRRARLGFVVTEQILAATVKENNKVIEDASRADEERLKAGASALQTINALYDARKRDLQEELDILQKQTALTDESTTIEDLEKIQQLQAKIHGLERGRNEELSTMQTKINNINKAIADKKAREEMEALNEEYKAFQERTKEMPKLFAQSNKDADLLFEGFVDTSKKAAEEAQKNLLRVAERARELGNREVEEKKKKSDRMKEEDRVREEGRLELAATTTDALASLFKEESAAHKALASATAVIDTYRAANAALAAPPGPPYTIPFMIATIIAGLANVAAINNVQLAKGGFLKLADGGTLQGIGGHIPNLDGSIAVGRSHAQGGIKFGRTEIEGGEPVLTKKIHHYPSLLKTVSDINVMAGGRPLVPRYHMQDGGIVTRQAIQASEQQLSTRQIVQDTIRNMPAPIVAVKDIRKGIQKDVDVENRAKIG